MKENSSYLSFTHRESFRESQDRRSYRTQEEFSEADESPEQSEDSQEESKGKGKQQKDPSKKVKFQKVKSFFGMWKRLITDPESFAQQPATPIHQITREKLGINEDKLIKTVLADHLESNPDSSDVLNAMKKSVKIFHEDFPGDYILKYEGKRLGMFLLHVCTNNDGTSEIKYTFNSDLKSFS